MSQVKITYKCFICNSTEEKIHNNEIIFSPYMEPIAERTCKKCKTISNGKIGILVPIIVEDIY